mmetsp:Transcript_4268/g.7039  ORF Transcript_4268/g.7039 Transcript_4268/m.7039 type:complete len:91 (+) Transcript_4268:95-367(+)
MPLKTQATNKNEEDRPSPQQQRELFGDGGGGGNTAAAAPDMLCPVPAPPGMPPPHLPVQSPGEATWTNTLWAMVDNMMDEMRLELQREMA